MWFLFGLYPERDLKKICHDITQNQWSSRTYQQQPGKLDRNINRISNIKMYNLKCGNPFFPFTQGNARGSVEKCREKLCIYIKK